MRRKRISFIMPFIDFAFMVIIIFLGMLSIAVFEAPGEPPRVVYVQPLTPSKPIPTTTTVSDKKQARERTRRQLGKTKVLEREVLRLKTMQKIDKAQTERQSAPKLLTPYSEVTASLEEWHAYTDLR